MPAWDMAGAHSIASSSQKPGVGLDKRTCMPYRIVVRKNTGVKKSLLLDGSNHLPIGQIALGAFVGSWLAQDQQRQICSPA